MTTSKKIRVLIVDDEELARDSIRVLLNGRNEWQIVAEAKDGREALLLINELKPDVIFLDINMPRLNGVDVLKQAHHKSNVVFTTAYDRYAIKAFEESAVDYLLKPYTDKRFYEALARVKSKIDNHDSLQRLESITQLLYGNNPRLQRVEKKIPIHLNDKIVLVEVNELLWVNASGNYVEIFTSQNKYLHHDSMSNMEQLLEEPTFLRIHRSHIVRSDYIKSLKKHPNGEYVIQLKNNIELKLSRTYKEKVERILGI